MGKCCKSDGQQKISPPDLMAQKEFTHRKFKTGPKLTKGLEIIVAICIPSPLQLVFCQGKLATWRTVPAEEIALVGHYTIHGIMGTLMANNFLFFRPCLDVKYGFSDYPWTSNIKRLCDWLPCRCAALPLVGCMSATSPICWGTHFLYLSNPPSGNLLPIIPWLAYCLIASPLWSLRWPCI